MKEEVLIENAGAIERVAFEVEGKKGGIIVFTGKMGAGKSTAIQAVGDLIRGKSDLSVRDGELMGRIKGFGREIVLGLGRRSGSAAGELEVSYLEGAIDPSVLVEPGLKDPLANDARRIIMLCRLAGVGADLSRFKKIVQDVESVASEKTVSAEDLPTQAACLKRDLEGRSRALSREADVDASKAQGLLASIANVEEGAVSEEMARGHLEQIAEERSTARAQATAYSTAWKAAEAARDLLRIEPVITADQQQIDDAQQEETRLEEELRQLEQAARECRERMRSMAVSVEAMTKVRAAEQSLQQQRAGAQALIEKLDAMPRHSAEHLASLDAELQMATNIVGRAVAAKKAAVIHEEAQELADSAAALTSNAERLRGAAQACELVVAQAVAEVAPMGLSIEGGRLFLATSRGKTLWADLSTGQRWKPTFEACLKAVGPGGLLALSQEAYQALDPDARVEISKQARDAGVWIATGEVTSGDLAAHVFGERA